MCIEKQLLFILFLFCTISSCNKKDNTNTKEVSKFWVHGLDHTGNEFFKHFFDAFQKGRLDAKFDLNLGNFNSADVEFIDEHPFDFVVSVPDRLAVFARSGFLREITSLVNVNEFVPLVIDNMKVNGKYYGIPLYFGNHLMLYYNKAFVNKPPKSTNELLEFCNTFIKRNFGKTCLEINQDEPYWLIPFITGFGGWIYSKDGHPSLDTVEVRKALEFIKSLKTKKYISSKCNYNCLTKRFVNSEAPIIIGGDWLIADLYDHFKKSLGISLLPIISETGLRMRPIVSGKFLVVNYTVNRKKQENISAFFKEFFSHKVQEEMMAQLKLLPSTREFYTSGELNSDDLILKESYKQAIIGIPIPTEPNIDIVWSAMRTYMKIFLEGRIDSFEATRMMQDEVSRYLD